MNRVQSETLSEFDKAVYSQNLLISIHPKKDLTVELALMHKRPDHHTPTLLQVRRPIFFAEKT